MPDSKQDVTVLLKEISAGRSGAMEELLPLVYDELKLLAHARLRREFSESTLATTGLVHEAYLKLVRRPENVDWQGRGHFFAVASRAMRQVLVSRAIARKAEKRGGSSEVLAIDEEIHMTSERADELIALDEALAILQKENERAAQVVDLRYFGGFSITECAEILGISDVTVSRDWKVARLWLHDIMSTDD